MSKRTKKSVSVISVLFALALGAFFMRATMASGTDADAANENPAFTMDGDVEVLLLRLGFRPEAVAAIGLNGSSMQSTLATHQAALEAAPTTLRDLDAACAEARVSVDALRRKVKSGQALAEEISELATAKQALATATASRVAFLDTLLAAICAQLLENTRARLQQIRANARWNQLPVQYLVKERTEAEWVALRGALSAKRTHQKMGNTVPQTALDLLATHDADNLVSVALASRDANLASVQASWDAVFNH